MQAAFAAATDPRLDFSEADFQLVSALIHREAGIVVRAHKQAMVKGRLARRARELGLATVGEYCALLRGDELQRELPQLINALTTNHTSFYREPHHFEHLEKVALPALGGGGRLRIWCCAASTGEEPYTISATVRAAFESRPHPDCLILATDLDSDVLATAERGRYSADAVAKLEDGQRRRLGIAPGHDGGFEIGEAGKRMIRFRQLNILHDWPFAGPFQIVFCRNMLIYFDQPTKAAVISRIVEKLAPGGYLYLGHSEALTSAHPGLKACGRTIYVKE